MVGLCLELRSMTNYICSSIKYVLNFRLPYSLSKDKIKSKVRKKLLLGRWGSKANNEINRYKCVSIIVHAGIYFYVFKGSYFLLFLLLNMHGDSGSY